MLGALLCLVFFSRARRLQNEKMLPSIVTCLSLLLCLADAFSVLDKRNGVKQHEEHDTKGAVASESSVCSRIGVDLIKQGGSAADAVRLPYVTQNPSLWAKRSFLTLDSIWYSLLEPYFVWGSLVGISGRCCHVQTNGVLGMYHSGIGGGGFMIV